MANRARDTDQKPHLSRLDPFRQFCQAIDDRWLAGKAVADAPSLSAASLDSDIAEVRDLLRKVESHIEQVVTTLSAYRNHIPKFNALPENVLVQIFCLVALDSSDGFLFNQEHVHISICIGRTCRLWRKIALRTPRMWTTLDLKSYPPSYWRLFIERSGDLGLDITADLQSEDQHQFSIRNAARARKLTLHGVNKQCDLFWKKLPLLETLVMHAHHRCNPALPHLFNAPDLRLKVLDLHNIFTRWTPTILNSLRHVSIDLHTRSSEGFDFPFADILRKSPILESFQLRSQMSIVDSITPVPKSLNLSRLDLVMTLSDVSKILSSVKMPDKGEISIKAAISPQASSNRTIELPSDPRYFPSLNYISKMEVNYRTFEVQGITKALHIALGCSKNSHPPFAVGATTGLLRSLTMQYRLLRLTKLCIVGYLASYGNGEDISLFLKHVPAITELQIEDCTPRLLESIQTHAKYSVTPFCAKLETVTVSEIQAKIEDLESFFESLARRKPLNHIQLNRVFLTNTTIGGTTSTIFRRIRQTCTRLEVQLVGYEDGRGRHTILD